MAKGFFITGTDTGVGKTVVAGAVIKALQALGMKVCAMKPIESGCRREGTELVPHDGAFLKQVAQMEDPLDLVTPCRFEAPLAPLAAATQEGKEVCIEELNKAYTVLCSAYEAIVVEGIGGLMVPIRRDYFIVDLAKEFSLPLLIVTKPGLGTINHTMLTVHHTLELGLEVAGLIINYSSPPEGSLAEKTNPDLLRDICPVPVISTFPYLKEVDENILEATALKNFDLEVLKRYLS